MVVLGEERIVSWTIIHSVGGFLSRSGHLNQIGRESNIELEWASGFLGPGARSNLKLAGFIMFSVCAQDRTSSCNLRRDVYSHSKDMKVMTCDSIP